MSQSSPSSAVGRTPLLSNKLYSVLKHVASIGLPALSALYFAVAHIWNLGDVDQIMATIAAVNTFLGAVLGYSTMSYNASAAKYSGVIQVDEGELKTVANLVFNDHPENVLAKTEAVFKIEPSPQKAPITETGTTAHGASL